MKKLSILLWIIALLGATAHAQSLSYPGASHRLKVTEVAGYLGVGNDVLSVATGMDGFAAVAISDSVASGRTIAVFDSAFNRKFTIEPLVVPSTLHQVAISSDRKVWHVQNAAGNLRFSILSESGTLLQSFRVNGYRSIGLFADSLGKVRVVLSNSGGIGMIQFTNAGTVDFAKWASTPGLGNFATCKMGIDGRILVSNGGTNYAMDLNGNIRKVMLAPNGYTLAAAYPDHSHAFLEQAFMGNPRMRICRLDSNMAPVWGMEFDLNNPFGQDDSIVSGQDAVVQPGTNNLMYACNLSSLNSNSANCNFPIGTFSVTRAEIGPDGTLRDKGWISIFAWAQTMRRLFNGAHGEPLLVDFDHFCVFGALGPRMVTLRQYPDNYYSPECDGSHDDADLHRTFFVPPSGTLLAVPASTPLAVTVLPDVATVTVGTSAHPGTSTCFPPCARIYDVDVQAGGQVQFQDSIAGCNSIQYNFGDGMFGANPDPVHAYPGPGNYPVQLIATNECGSDTLNLGTITPCRTAAMTTPSNVCVGQSFALSQTSTFVADSVSWWVNGFQLGTGNTLNYSSPIATTLQVMLIAKDGACTDTAFQAIAVAAVPPIPDFTFASIPGQGFAFINQTTLANIYLWDFGDGGTSTLANPIHYYTGSGPYTICLTANGCGAADTCKTMPCPFVQAGFSVQLAGGGQVSIVDSSTGASSIVWDFGDGTTASGPVSIHAYSQSGSFVICQIVQNACFADTFCTTIEVIANNQVQFRVGVSGLSAVVPKAQAVSDDGWIMVLGSSTQGKFITLFDSTGVERWTKFMTPSSYFDLRDVTSMPNGNFLVVGGVLRQSTGYQEGFWMELDRQGNVGRQDTLIGLGPNYISTIKRGRYGGYLFTSFILWSAPGNYGRLDDDLHLSWCRKSNQFRVFGLLQAPDSTYWDVQLPATTSGPLKYVHINQAGTPFEEVTQVMSSASHSTGYVESIGFEMGCNGELLTALEFNVNQSWSQGSGFCTGIYSYNPTTGTSSAKVYSLVSSVWDTEPTFNSEVNDLAITGNGAAQLIGTAYPYFGGHSYPPKDQRLMYDITFPAISATPSLAGGASSNEAGFGIGTLVGGSMIRTETVDGEIQIEKYAPGAAFCNAMDSTPILTRIIGTNVPATLSSTVTGTFLSLGTAVPANFQPLQAEFQPTIACMQPCSTSVQAGFVVSSQTANSVTLTSISTPGASILWNTGGGSMCNIGNSITLTLPPCGSQQVMLSAGDGCDQSTIVQTIGLPGSIAMPVLDTLLLSDSTVACNVTMVQLAADTGYTSYLWGNGSTTATTMASTSANMSLIVGESNGCYLTDTAAFDFMTTTADLGPDIAICAGESSTLTTNQAYASYLWSTGDTTGSLIVSAAGTYTVEVMDSNGCAATDTLVVSLLASPSPFLGADTTIYVGSNLTLSGGTGFSAYLWSTGATSQSILVTQSGTYWVQVTDANGCIGTDTITVSVIVGVAQSYRSRLDVSPVPADDQVRIALDVPAPQRVQLVVHDLFGRPVWQMSDECNGTFSTKISVEKWPSGIYYLSAIGQELRMTRKLEVIH